MAITQYARLYSADASETVRQGLTAADAGTWTPDDIADEDDRRAVIFDAREWETIKLFVDGTDGAGAGAALTSITVEPLIAVPSDLSDAVRGRAWLAMTSLGAVAPGDAVEVEVSGHFAAFRAAAITLGAATDGRIRVTGGRRRTQNND